MNAPDQETDLKDAMDADPHVSFKTNRSSYRVLQSQFLAHVPIKKK